MKVWVLLGVDFQESVPYDTLLGIFTTKELMMEYRKRSGVDSDYAYIEYAEHPVITEISPKFMLLGEPITPNPFDEFVKDYKEYK